MKLGFEISKRRSRWFGLLLTVPLVIAACTRSGGEIESSSPNAEPKGPQERVSPPAFAAIEDLAGPASTQDSSSSLSFNVPIPTLQSDEVDHHLRGDALFSRKFVNETGLGPAFNANSCIACHAVDGRGSLPVIPPGQSKVKLGANEAILLRVSLGEGADSRGVPGFTEQLFHRGVYDLRPESPGVGQAEIEMDFTSTQFVYPDGRQVELRTPRFKILNAYDSIAGGKSALDDPDLRISPRMGPPMIGLGLLEAIEDRDIVALADPDDRNNDGISGRANFIDGKLGRFGWKANTASLRLQVAGALSNDMGLRSSLKPIENIAGTDLFANFITRIGSLFKPLNEEVSDEALDALEFYSATLAVPRRRDIKNPSVLAGAGTFEKLNCTGCHTPHFRTSDSLGVSTSLRGLDIYPFSDGLLHDMGSDLADHRDDHLANGREWKTRPLWGIGMTQTINPRAGYLHDGRARTLEEAVLFHGGEAAGSRDKFVQLPQPDRENVLLFLKSL